MKFETILKEGDRNPDHYHKYVWTDWCRMETHWILFPFNYLFSFWKWVDKLWWNYLNRGGWIDREITKYLKKEFDRQNNLDTKRLLKIKYLEQEILSLEQQKENFLRAVYGKTNKVIIDLAEYNKLLKLHNKTEKIFCYFENGGYDYIGQDTIIQKLVEENKSHVELKNKQAIEIVKLHDSLSAHSFNWKEFTDNFYVSLSLGMIAVSFLLGIIYLMATQ